VCATELHDRDWKPRRLFRHAADDDDAGLDSLANQYSAHKPTCLHQHTTTQQVPDHSTTMKFTALAATMLVAAAGVASVSADDYQPALRALAAPEPAAPNAAVATAAKETTGDAKANANGKKEWGGGPGFGFGGPWGGWGGLGGWGGYGGFGGRWGWGW